MQSCHCYKRTQKGVCTSDSQQHLQETGHSNSDADAFIVDESSNMTNIKVCDGKHVLMNENMSVITTVENFVKDAYRDKGHIRMENPHSGMAPYDTTISADSAIKRGYSILSCEQRDHDLSGPKEITSTSELEKVFLPEGTSYQPKSHKEKDDLNIKNALANSTDSHNSKNLSAEEGHSGVLASEDTTDMVSVSGNLSQQKCPICLLFQSSSNTALNAHIDHCLITSSSKKAATQCISKLQKGKMRKKRSMAELFQASTPFRNEGSIHPSLASNGELLHQQVWESNPKKQLELHKSGLENILKRSCHEKRLKTQNQALHYLRQRCKSGLPSHHEQNSLVSASTSKLHEFFIVDFYRCHMEEIIYDGDCEVMKETKLTFMSRKKVQKGSPTIKKRQWKHQSINHKSPMGITIEVSGPSNKNGLQNLEEDGINKGALALEDTAQSLNAFTQQNISNPVDLFQTNKTSHKGKSPANTQGKSVRRWRSKETSFFKALDTILTIEGPEKTMFKILKPHGVNKENRTKKVQFRLHVGSTKKRNKQRNVEDVNEAVHTCPIIQTNNNSENTTCIAARDLNGNYNYRTSDRAVRPSISPVPSRDNLPNEQNNIPINISPRNENLQAPGPFMPPFASAIQSQQVERRVTERIIRNPQTDKEGSSRTQNGTGFSKEMSNSPVFPLEHQSQALRNNTEMSALQSLYSVPTECIEIQMSDCQDAHHVGFSMQRPSSVPYFLHEGDISRWPFNSETSNFQVIRSGCTPTAAYHLCPHPVHMSKICQKQGGGGSKNHEFGPTTQEGMKCHQFINIPGLRFSDRSEMSEGLNKGSTNQKLPAWMQAAVQDQRLPTMSANDLPADSVSQSSISKTMPIICNEVMTPSQTFNKIENPVFRLMGTTVILMPESKSSQLDLNSNHFSASMKSNYLQSFDSEGNHQKHRSRSQLQDSTIQDGMPYQDCLGSTTGFHGLKNAEFSSTPQISDLNLQMPLSTPQSLPLTSQRVGTMHLTGHRRMPVPDDGFRLLQCESSSLPTMAVNNAQTNWQYDIVTNPTSFRSHSDIFCQQTNEGLKSPTLRNEISEGRHLAALEEINPLQSLTELFSQHPTNRNDSSLSCWLSKNNTDQAAEVILLDSESPFCSSNSSSHREGREMTLRCKFKENQSQNSPSAQWRQKSSDCCDSAHQKRKAKTFIPVIYTAGTNFRESHCARGLLESMHYKLNEDVEFRKIHQGYGVLHSSRKGMSCLQNSSGNARISQGYRNDATRSTKVNPGYGNFAVPPSSESLLKGLHSADDKGMERLFAEAVSFDPKYQQSRQDRQELQQESRHETTTQTFASQAPGTGICSINMNPAEIDCQDAGQFLSAIAHNNDKDYTPNWSNMAHSSFTDNNMVAVTMPSTSNLHVRRQQNDAHMFQGYTSSRMQSLKLGGKFKIENGRVSLIQKTMHAKMMDAAKHQDDANTSACL
ncbi:hypothetical protein KP509_25G042000 [Ceratopteris richardii]|nr:hypothetical protein KP509_25G042000 [Ceratopteris richardii]